MKAIGRMNRDGKRGSWYEPTQADAQYGGFVRREAAETDEVDAHDVGAGQAVGSSAVDVGGWRRRERKSALTLAVPFRYSSVYV